MTITIPKSAFPLAWPAGIKRTGYPEPSVFHQIKKMERNGTPYKNRAPLENSACYRELVTQVNLIRGIRTVVVSSNLDINEKSGIAYFDGPNKPNGDAGVAVYWTRQQTRAGESTLVPYCMPCDKWNRIADNLHALALSIEALRGMDRWGCVSVEQAFSGFAALPPGSGETVGGEASVAIEWRESLSMGRVWPTGVDPAELLLLVRARYRQLMQDAHPDKPGGSTEKASMLNRALELAERELGQ